MKKELLMRKIAAKLKDSSKTLATAESCTGGLLGVEITKIPGSSQYYLGGVISYANEVKINVLKVNKESIDKDTAVSPQVAKEMAQGVRTLLAADYSVATTGIAGPGGFSETKPLGLVYIAIASKEVIKVYENIFEGSRCEIQNAAMEKAFEYLFEELEQNG